MAAGMVVGLARLGEVASAPEPGGRLLRRPSASTTSGSSFSPCRRGTGSRPSRSIWRGFWIGIGISAWMTLITELVPENLLSRVLSFDTFGSFALTPDRVRDRRGRRRPWSRRQPCSPSAGRSGSRCWFVPLLDRRVRLAWLDANLYALGVWRSLVARSVRVGEVPSSNLGTPMRRTARGAGL